VILPINHQNNLDLVGRKLGKKCIDVGIEHVMGIGFLREKSPPQLLMAYHQRKENLMVAYLIVVVSLAICLISILEDNWTTDPDPSELEAEILYWDAYYKWGLPMDLILLED